MGVTPCLLCVRVKVTPSLDRLIFSWHENNRGPRLKWSVELAAHILINQFPLYEYSCLDISPKKEISQLIVCALGIQWPCVYCVQVSKSHLL